ncbi:DDE superfamily endonuclease [Rhizobacter sp. OV335]|nr:DDE superfamily endonuclease [Rhizobacter sp. OV335]
MQDWLAKHPRFVMHFTPTTASWLNMVERFFRDISENCIKRDSFTSVAELELVSNADLAGRRSSSIPSLARPECESAFTAKDLARLELW